MQKQIKLQPRLRNGKNVPELRLLGLWLEKQGFLSGQKVTITTRKELLIIRPVGEAAH